MNRVVCRITLAEGVWQERPTPWAVRRVLRPRTVRGAMAALTFEEGEGLVAEAVVFTRYCHAEIIRDNIVAALLKGFQPEYESMVEVEVCE